MLPWHVPTGYSEDAGLDQKVWEGLHVSAVFERAEELYVIHNTTLRRRPCRAAAWAPGRPGGW